MKYFVEPVDVTDEYKRKQYLSFVAIVVILGEIAIAILGLSGWVSGLEYSQREWIVIGVVTIFALGIYESMRDELRTKRYALHTVMREYRLEGKTFSCVDEEVGPKPRTRIKHRFEIGERAILVEDWKFLTLKKQLFSRAVRIPDEIFIDQDTRGTFIESVRAKGAAIHLSEVSTPDQLEESQ